MIAPLVDRFVDQDRRNPPDEIVKSLENDKYYRRCTYLYLPLQYAGLVFGCWTWVNSPMGPFEKFAMAATLGVVGGVGINAAHELGHKRTKLERRLAKIALAQSFYGHFYVEHNHGHHLRVATPEDPATARFGEGYWRFLPRTVFGSLRSAWEYESARLRRRGRSPWNPLRNNILNAWALSVALFGALLAAFGWQIAPWLVAQAVMAVMFLEAVNYLEHYGLLREKRPDGRYVRVAAPPQLEQRPRVQQSVPLQPAAAQRPPRQSDAPLPDPAQHAGSPAAACRLRGAGRHLARPAAVAPRHGSTSARALRPRPVAHQHRPTKRGRNSCALPPL